MDVGRILPASLDFSAGICCLVHGSNPRTLNPNCFDLLYLFRGIGEFDEFGWANESPVASLRIVSLSVNDEHVRARLSGTRFPRYRGIFLSVTFEFDLQHSERFLSLSLCFFSPIFLLTFHIAI